MTAAVFLLVLLLGAGAAVMGVLSAGEPILRAGAAADSAGLTDGSLTAEADEALEERHALRDVALSGLAAVRYLLFREAVGAAVVGSNGWLFTTEELEHHPRDEERLQHRLREIRESALALNELDIAVVVALVPAKARMAEAELPRRWARLARRERYDAALETLRAAGITVVDLRPVLSADRFFARDTHWRPSGAAAAAEAVAREVGANEAGTSGSSGSSNPGSSSRYVSPARALAGAERVRYEREAMGSITVSGDLMRFLPLGALREPLGLGPEEAPLYEVRRVSGAASGGGEAAGGLGLFDELRIPVALVGTSYSRDERWGFADALKAALRADVLNVASEGEGPFEPMREYLAGDSIHDVTPRLVVWEIPERYLTIPP